jgi:uncharacterized delta-60 repeat protein
MPVYTPAGTLDTCFIQEGNGFDNEVHCMVVQPNGKILVGGFFAKYNGKSCKHICRLNEDGTLDTSFKLTGTGLDGFVNELILQSDGKILIGGLNAYNGIPFPNICRLNSDGTLDTTFSPEGKVLDALFWPMVSQSDGKILVGGHYGVSGNNIIHQIRRLNVDGSLDSSFLPFLTTNGLHTIFIQGDGKILAAWDTGYYTPKHFIVRLNSDGTIDTTFNLVGSGFDWLGHEGFFKVQAIQPNGKIIITGNFSSYNGNASEAICRLNIDGSQDTTFRSTPPFTWTEGIYGLVLQPDGKMIFTGGNDGIFVGLRRINSDGSPDTTFDVGSGLKPSAYPITLCPDGKVLVGGDITTYNDTPRNSLIRLFATDSLPLATRAKAESKLLVYPNPAQDILNIQTTEVIKDVQVYDVLGRVQKTMAVVNNQITVSGLQAGMYLLRVSTSSGTQAIKWYKE